MKKTFAVVSCALMLLMMPHGARAQSGTVSGTITAEGAGTQRPLAGAQVVVEGVAGKGAVTDGSGKFTITGLSGSTVILSVRLIGYRPGTDTVSVGSTDLQFTLSERTLELNQMVVTGTAGGAQKRELGTAVVAVDAVDVLDQTAVTNVEGLLNGRAPGVNIIPSSGQVGQQATIRIRGLGTLSLSSTPLIYVDGIQVNNARFDDFDPEQIERIETLEGPAAATLYGTAAARGVINIITKKGQEGAPRWSFTQQDGINTFQNASGRTPTNYWLPPGEVLGAAPNDTLWHINYYNSEKAAGRSPFQTGNVNRFSTSVSGGSGLYRYFVSADVNSASGIQVQNGQQMKSFRTNLSVVPTSKLDIETSVGYVTSHTNLELEDNAGGSFFSTELSSPQYTPAACPLLYPAPKVVARGCGWSNGAYGADPPNLFAAYQNWTDIQRFTGNISIKWDPFPWFSNRFLFGTDYTQSDVVSYLPYQTDSMTVFYLGSSFDGNRTETYSPTTVNTYDYNGTVHFDLKPNLVSKSTLGIQYYTNYNTSLSASGSHFPSPGLSTITATGTKGSPTSGTTGNNTLGSYFQQEFALDNRLFITGALRVDNNSAFGTQATFTTYPKISVSWVASEEPRFRSMLPQFISDLRLRAAYGGSGQQPTTNSALQTLTPIAGPGGATVLTYGNIGNSDLKPETVLGTELGFEAGLWKDRVGINFTYFNDVSHNAIISVTPPPSTGYTTTAFENAGQINKSGIELAIRASILQTRKFGWDVQANIGTAHSRIVQLISGDTILGGNRVGYAPGDIFTYKFVSATYVPPTGAQTHGTTINPLCATPQGGTTPCFAAGSSTIIAPQVFAGHAIPQTTGGLSNTFHYGSFRLYAMIDFQTGYKREDATNQVRCQVLGTCLVNYYPQFFNPAYVAEVQTGNPAYLDQFLSSASFAKWRDLAISYDVPPVWARKVGARSLGITLSGHNLATFTKYSGVDPENSYLSSGTSNMTTDQTGNPQLTSYTVSFRLVY